ncbi:MAG: hypothetical protein AB8C84_13125 [Oligoflexales bacterium]
MTNPAQAMPEFNYCVSRKSRYEHSKSLGFSPWDLIKHSRSGVEPQKIWSPIQITPRTKVREEWLDRYLILSAIDPDLAQIMLKDLCPLVSDDLADLEPQVLDRYMKMGSILSGNHFFKDCNIYHGSIQQSQSYYDRSRGHFVKLYSDYLSHDGSKSFQIHVVSESQLRRAKRGLMPFKHRIHQDLISSLSRILYGKDHEASFIFVSENSCYIFNQSKLSKDRKR